MRLTTDSGTGTALKKYMRAILRFLRSALKGGMTQQELPIMQDTLRECNGKVDAKDKFRQSADASADSRGTTLPKGFYTSPNKNPERVRVLKQAEFMIDIPEHHIRCGELTAKRLWQELDKYFGGSRYIVTGSREPQEPPTTRKNREVYHRRLVDDPSSWWDKACIRNDEWRKAQVLEKSTPL